jgi:ADP-ribosylation factor protein 1
MGLPISRLVGSLLGIKEMSVLVLSLEGAGKTTILYKLKPGDVTAIPTIDFNIEAVQHGHISFYCMGFKQR